MQDGLQQALQGVATHNIVARDLIIVCAGALIFLMGIAWVIALIRRRTTLTLATVGHIVVLGLLTYLVARVLGHLIIDPRPYLVAHTHPFIPLPHDNGFPSDHTLLAALMTASLWWVDRRLVAAFAGATVLVALGRLGIEAHHTLDVLGSMAITLVAAFVARVVPFPLTWGRPLLPAQARASGVMARPGAGRDPLG